MYTGIIEEKKYLYIDWRKKEEKASNYFSRFVLARLNECSTMVDLACLHIYTCEMCMCVCTKIERKLQSIRKQKERKQ